MSSTGLYLDDESDDLIENNPNGQHDEMALNDNHERSDYQHDYEENDEDAAADLENEVESSMLFEKAHFAMLISINSNLSIDDDVNENLPELTNHTDRILFTQQSFQFEFDSDGGSINQENIQQQQFLSQLTDFIHTAHLNKTTTSILLSLLRSTSSLTTEFIPKTPEALWKQLGVTFSYRTFYYCSTCFSELVRYQDTCSICNSKERANSELCIFSIKDEIDRVVQSNIDVIEWYRAPENQIIADLVNGK